ncbi:MAG: DNA repair protein [Nitrosopumilales archaeon]|nr:MAG: DNA repair protein [Nitrosopumilales archaeon]
MRTSRINIDYTINSGQVFLWEKIDKNWYGINGKEIFCIRQNPFKLSSSTKKSSDLFRQTDNVEKILKNISKDEIVRASTKKFQGLRLIRQNPFQCYISFICSSNTNIKNIKQMLQKLCKKFGRQVKFEEKYFFTFPDPQTLANASLRDLLSCGLGFRAKSVKKASKDVIVKKVDFDHLKKIDYITAKETLKSVRGIGNKIADCILLFSLEKLEAFPIDRWTWRILKKYYSEKFELQNKTLTEKKYEEIHEKIVEYFGPYAGYAQQFLFKMERDLNQKKWL